jgi:acetylornithine aminotransferase
MPDTSAAHSPDQWRTRWQNAIMNNYGTPDLALVRGEGLHVYDSEGDRYVDLIGGIAVNALGHGHLRLIEAVSQQMRTLGHTSNLFITPPALELSERLAARLGQPAKAFFCNSGTEANEAAMKIARRTGRTKIVAVERGFHGRTMGALSMTGQPTKQAPFEPLVPGVQFVPHGDFEALSTAVDDQTAAVILEPILGEAGIVPAPPGYLAHAREVTTRNGALLILDEVQTGVARTGTFYAHEPSGVVPDVVTLAKGLGGGLPIGVCLAVGDIADLLQPGDHGATFGGNPVSVAAALAVLNEIESNDLATNARTIGEQITRGVTDLQHPLVATARGAGLLVGIVLREPLAKAFVAAARDAGYLVNAAAPDVVRLAPPLVIDAGTIDGFLAALPNILDRTAA